MTFSSLRGFRIIKFTSVSNTLTNYHGTLTSGSENDTLLMIRHHSKAILLWWFLLFMVLMLNFVLLAPLCTFSYFWLNLGNLVATCFRYVFLIYVPDF